jgi:hypothetical protein
MGIAGRVMWGGHQVRGEMEARGMPPSVAMYNAIIRKLCEDAR